MGLPDAAVKEARNRVKSAAKNSGFSFPTTHITVNLAPADLRKEGTVYDLPMMVGLLQVSHQLDARLDDCGFVGEVALSCELRPVRGMPPTALAARRAGMECLYVPAEDAAEATLAGGITGIFGADPEPSGRPPVWAQPDFPRHGSPPRPGGTPPSPTLRT